MVREGAKKPKYGIRIKPLDAVIILAIVILSLSIWLFLPAEGETVLVMWHGEQIYCGSIDVDIEIVTPDGLNTISVSQGYVYMNHAECADKTCIQMGNASSGRPVVCLPNRVIITITGGSGVDSVTW